MKDIELRLVCELIRNCRKSDRELAKAIGVSQPTVSRIRRRLEKEEVISYGAMPDLGKLGYEMIAMTFARWNREQHSDTRVAKAKDFITKHPNIIFVSTGIGLDSDRIAISAHKNYSDYAQYLAEIRTEWAELMRITGSFIISINSDNVLRPISLRYLAECLNKEKSQ